MSTLHRCGQANNCIGGYCPNEIRRFEWGDLNRLSGLFQPAKPFLFEFRPSLTPRFFYFAGVGMKSAWHTVFSLVLFDFQGARYFMSIIFGF